MSPGQADSCDTDDNMYPGDRPHDEVQLQGAGTPADVCGDGYAHFWQVNINAHFWQVNIKAYFWQVNIPSIYFAKYL